MGGGNTTTLLPNPGLLESASLSASMLPLLSISPSWAEGALEGGGPAQDPRKHPGHRWMGKQQHSPLMLWTPKDLFLSLFNPLLVSRPHQARKHILSLNCPSGEPFPSHLHFSFPLTLKGCCDSWFPEENNSIQGQRGGLIAYSFCVIKFY